jgi:hypothetical protein
MKKNRNGKNPDLYAEIIDGVITYGSFRAACRKVGISEMALWRWRRDSEDGISEFQEIEYRGVVQPLHRHLEDAIEQSVDEIESTLRASARDGYTRPVIHHGQFQFIDDEYACGLSDADFETALAIGEVWPDKKLRVKNENGVWERVKIMEHVRGTTEAQLAVLRAWSERYADKRSVKFEGSMQVGYGATTIGKPLAPPAALPQLQVITPELADQVNENVSEAVFEEEEDEMTSLTPRPPLPEPEADDTIVGSSPLTAEQQAILARARSGNALAADLAARALARKPPSAAPPPAVPVYRGDLDQPDDVPRTPVGKKIL